MPCRRVPFLINAALSAAVARAADADVEHVDAAAERADDEARAVRTPGQGRDGVEVGHLLFSYC